MPAVIKIAHSRPLACSNTTPYTACPRGWEQVAMAITQEITFPIKCPGVFICTKDIVCTVNKVAHSMIKNAPAASTKYFPISGTDEYRIPPMGNMSRATATISFQVSPILILPPRIPAAIPPAIPPKAMIPDRYPYIWFGSAFWNSSTWVQRTGSPMISREDMNKFTNAIITVALPITFWLFAIKCTLSFKSPKIMRKAPILVSLFVNGILIKISITAERKKHTILMASTTWIPFIL